MDDDEWLTADRMAVSTILKLQINSLLIIPVGLMACLACRFGAIYTYWTMGFPPLRSFVASCEC